MAQENIINNEAMVEEVTDLVCEPEVISGGSGIGKKALIGGGILLAGAGIAWGVKKWIVPIFKKRKHKDEETLEVADIEDEYPIKKSK